MCKHFTRAVMATNAAGSLLYRKPWQVLPPKAGTQSRSLPPLLASTHSNLLPLKRTPPLSSADAHRLVDATRTSMVNYLDD